MQGYDGVYIVGAGQTPYEKRTGKTVQRLIWEASDAALDSAGLSFADVDGLAGSSFVLSPDNVTTMTEHLGIQARWLYQGLYGGASGIIGLLHAARAVQAGDAEVVVVVAADVFDVDSHMDHELNGVLHDYMAPYGYGAPNGMFALHTRRYMAEHGVERADFGRLCVAQRENALGNPNALFKTALTMEDYLSARPIAEPIHLFDCVHPCCGGEAIIVTGAAVAERLAGPAVRLLGGGAAHNTPANDVYALSAGWETFRERMFAQAGCRPADMDFVQLYDDYPVMAFIQLEGMGFAARGEAARLVREHDCTVRGDFPVNTGGGQLSAGQCGASGGTLGLYEAVVQLRGEGGERQVRNARLGCAAGYGMVSYGRGLSASACILGAA